MPIKISRNFFVWHRLTNNFFRAITIIVRGGTVSLRDPTPEYLAPTNEYWTFPTFDENDRRRVQTNDISIVKLGQPIVYSSEYLLINSYVML